MSEMLDHRENVIADGIGEISLVQAMANDESVVNAARVSFGQRIDLLDEKDGKLIKYLANERHTSPFEHTAFTFYVKCPLFVTRQWHRHRTWSYNEISRRYTSKGIQFSIPTRLRKQGTKEDKQQSDKTETLKYIIRGNDRGDVYGMIEDYVDECVEFYDSLIDQGVAREQARMVLPQNMYTEFYATVDFHNLMHFIGLRDSEHAQWEIRQYAVAMREMITTLMPLSVAAVLKAQANK